MLHCRMMSLLRSLVFLLAVAGPVADAFAVQPASTSLLLTTPATKLAAAAPFAVLPPQDFPFLPEESTSSAHSLLLSASTIDPTTFFSDIFGAVVGTPLILAIPIVAALAVASTVVYLLVSYANPAEPDE